MHYNPQQHCVRTAIVCEFYVRIMIRVQPSSMQIGMALFLVPVLPYTSVYYTVVSGYNTELCKVIGGDTECPLQPYLHSGYCISQ